MASLMDLIKQKKQSINTNRERTVKPPEGRSRWRILPSWRPETHAQAGVFWHDFGQHFIKDGAGALKAVYVCTDRTYGRPCEVCDALQMGISSCGDDSIVERLKEANASTRHLLNALHRDGPNPGTPVILEIGPKLFGDFLSIIDEWGVDTLELDGGRDVIIERTGKGLSTKYSIQIAAKSEAVPASVMSSIKNLDEYVAQESEEQKVRAIANVRNVAGLLGSSGASASRPALASVADELDIDGTLTIPGEPLHVAEEAVVTPAAAASAAAADSDLDDLLAELG